MPHPLTPAALAAYALDSLRQMTADERAQVAEKYSDGKTMSADEAGNQLARLSMKLRLSNAQGAIDAGQPLQQVSAENLESNPFPIKPKPKTKTGRLKENPRTGKVEYAD
jgi:hypothetical protein